MRPRNMKVLIDNSIDNNAADEYIYFEVWVYNRLTGGVFMCAPRMMGRRMYI